MRRSLGLVSVVTLFAAAPLPAGIEARAQAPTWQTGDAEQVEEAQMSSKTTQESAEETAQETGREKALGIGGLFVRSKDPAALSAWYTRHFGINPTPTSYDDEPWVQEEGPTIFAPMPQDVDMIPEGTSWMLNLRVADLDKMVAQLIADGVEVALDPETYPNGRFATLADPEGNAIQLWEPA